MKAADLFDGDFLTEVTREMWPFRSQIADQEQVRCALALARQKRVAAAEARIRRGFIDGVGEVVARIDADIYHRLAAIYGYGTVNSSDFLKALLRDNPELRVKSVSRKTGIVVPAEWQTKEERSTLKDAECDAQPVTDAEMEGAA